MSIYFNQLSRIYKALCMFDTTRQVKKDLLVNHITRVFEQEIEKNLLE